MILADISSFLGTLWFVILVGVGSYIAGSVIPIQTLLMKIFKK